MSQFEFLSSPRSSRHSPHVREPVTVKSSSRLESLGLEQGRSVGARPHHLTEGERERADGSGLVFPSPMGKPFSNMALSKLFRELEIPAVPHGFRSSFRDRAQECTNAPRAMMEAACVRSDLFERRWTLMDQWTAYLNQASDKVVPLVRRG